MMPWLKITRPGNALMAGGSVLVGTLCVEFPLFSREIVWSVFAFLFFAAAGNVHNDLRDYRTDVENRPRRILPAGLLELRQAAVLTFLLYTLAILSTLPLFFLVSLPKALLVFSCLPLLLLYNEYLKNSVLWGNLVVALLCALPLLYPSLLQSTMAGWTAVFFAFWFTLVRELVKDAEDLAGDSITGIRTAATAWGEKRLKQISLLLLTTGILATFMPGLTGRLGISYTVAIFLLILPTGLSAAADIQKQNWTEARKKLKTLMLCGLFALLSTSF